MFEMLRVLLLPSLLLPPDPGAGPGHSSARLPISPVYTGNAGRGSWDGIARVSLQPWLQAVSASAVSIAECYVCEEETGTEIRGFCDRSADLLVTGFRVANSELIRGKGEASLGDDI